MADKALYEKLKDVLDYVEGELKKPLENHNYDSRLWSKGYRKAMLMVKNFILKILN